MGKIKLKKIKFSVTVESEVASINYFMTICKPVRATSVQNLNVSSTMATKCKLKSEKWGKTLQGHKMAAAHVFNIVAQMVEI